MGEEFRSAALVGRHVRFAVAERDAAGAIHTDLARGFIRAETIAYEDLLATGAIAEAKKHGKVRSEGKTYHVRDGDVIEILFSR